jgi:hypothetical protein
MPAMQRFAISTCPVYSIDTEVMFISLSLQGLIITHIFATYAISAKGKEILRQKIDQASPQEGGALGSVKKNHSVFASSFWSPLLSDKNMVQDKLTGEKESSNNPNIQRLK